MIREKAKIITTDKNFLFILALFLGASFIGIQILVQDCKIIVLFLLGSGILLLIVNRPVWGLYFIAFISPLNQLQQFDFVLLSSVIRMIGLATLISFFLCHFITQKHTLIKTDLFAPLVVFVFAYIVGLFRAYDLGRALDQVMVLSMYFILYLLVVNLVKDQKTVKEMFWILTIAVSGLAFFGIAQYLRGETLFPPEMGRLSAFDVGNQAVIRVIGVFRNPNAFAYNYVLSVPLMIGILMVQKRRFYQWIIAGLLFTCIVCLFLTFSRSAFLAVWVSVSIILFFLNRRQKVMIGMGLLGIPIIIYTFSPNLFEILQYRLLSTSSYMGIQQRIELIKGGIDTFTANPFIGAGTSNASVVLGKYTYKFLYGPHNNMIAVLVETGLLGFVPFSLIFINFTKKILTVISGPVDRDSRIILIAILASIWGYFVNGLFHTNIAYGPWWMIIGLGMAYANIVEYTDNRNLSHTGDARRVDKPF